MPLSRTIYRPLRWLGHGLFGVLLLGFVATLLVWALTSHGSKRHYFSASRADHLQAWGYPSRRAVSLEVIGGTTQSDGRFLYDWMDSRWQTTRTLPFGILLGSRPPSDPHPSTYFRIVVPCRVLALATGVPALLWFGVRGAKTVRARRLRAAAHGNPLCAKCGYDLRATPDRCPECGTSTTVASHTAA
jgi:hypothetical protein